MTLRVKVSRQAESVHGCIIRIAMCNAELIWILMIHTGKEKVRYLTEELHTRSSSRHLVQYLHVDKDFQASSISRRYCLIMLFNGRQMLGQATIILL